jgi:hypothetical protein
MDTRETTLAIRWVCNPDLANYGYWREVTREILGQPRRSRRLTDSRSNRFPLICILGERLREGITGDSHLLLCDSGLCRDLLNGALDNVSWLRVAEALVAEHSERGTGGRHRRSLAMTA